MTYTLLIEKLTPKGRVKNRETVKVEADSETDAVRKSNFIRKMRFCGGGFDMRVTVKK